MDLRPFLETRVVGQHFYRDGFPFWCTRTSKKIKISAFRKNNFGKIIPFGGGGGGSPTGGGDLAMPPPHPTPPPPPPTPPPPHPPSPLYTHNSKAPTPVRDR